MFLISHWPRTCFLFALRSRAGLASYALPSCASCAHSLSGFGKAHSTYQLLPRNTRTYRRACHGGCRDARSLKWTPLHTHTPSRNSLSLSRSRLSRDSLETRSRNIRCTRYHSCAGSPMCPVDPQGPLDPLDSVSTVWSDSLLAHGGAPFKISSMD